MARDFKIIFTFISLVLGGVLLFGNMAKAQSNPPLEVKFQNEPQPLFYETNFLPGQSVTGWVKVTNKSGEAQKIATEAVNYPNPIPSTDLSRALIIVIKKNTKELYGVSADPKTLSDFYLDSGKPSPEDDKEIYLSDLKDGETVQYDITISFPIEKGSEYQNKTTGFDLVIGFQGPKVAGTKATGMVLGAAIGPAEETLPQKVGKVLGVAVGSPILTLLLISFLLASIVYLISLTKNRHKV